MRALSTSFKISKDRFQVIDAFLFLYFFLNAADLLHISCGIFKLRASYAFNFLFFPLMFIYGVNISKKFLMGFFFFSIFSALSAINSSLFWRSFSYLLQEVYILAGSFFVAAWIIRAFSTARVLSMYFAAYLTIAGYGLWQFATPFFGISDPFVFQTIAGFFNRPNSLCLEPAYFAFYTSIAACALSVYCAFCRRVSFKLQISLFILSTAALFTMTTTALAMFLCLAFISFAIAIALKKRTQQKGYFKALSPLVASFVVYVCTLVMAPDLSWHVMGKFFKVDGTLTSGPDTLRVEHAASSWEYFKKHPLLGYSYGGLGPLVYTQLINDESENLDHLEGEEFYLKDPQPIPFQLIASFGLIGVLGFAIAGYLFIKKSFKAMKLAKATIDKNLAIASIASLSAIAIGGIWMSGVLIPAIWVHLGLCYGLWSKICSENQTLS